MWLNSGQRDVSRDILLWQRILLRDSIYQLWQFATQGTLGNILRDFCSSQLEVATDIKWAETSQTSHIAQDSPPQRRMILLKMAIALRCWDFGFRRSIWNKNSETTASGPFKLCPDSKCFSLLWSLRSNERWCRLMLLAMVFEISWVLNFCLTWLMFLVTH